MVARNRYIKDPPSVFCPNVITHYGSSLEEMAVTEALETPDKSIKFWLVDLDTDVSRTGAYSCFCQNELVEYEKDPSTLYHI